jgi:hypothetical protein
MEHLLFVPSNRLHDRIENGGGRLDYFIGIIFCEVELTTAGQDLVMNGQCTWKQFTKALGDKIVWVGENAYLDFWSNHDIFFNASWIMAYGVDGRALSVLADIESSDRIVADVWADSTEQASTAVHLLCRLLTTSGARVVEFDNAADDQTFFRPSFPFSGPALSQLIQQCPSLTHLHLNSFLVDEEIVHALWAGAGTNIEMVLKNCRTTLSGTNALIESFRRNLGPTQFITCFMPTEIFAHGLRGNSNIKILRLRKTRPFIDGNLLNLLQSLSQNQGLREIHFGEHAFCDDNWSMLCQSLAGHPSLERMDVLRGRFVPLSKTQKRRRTEMLAEMLKVNTVLHSITVTLEDYNQRIIHDEVRPRLFVNNYRPRVRAMRTQSNDNSLRAKLLERALHSVNEHPTILWMFLTSHKDHLMRGVQE